jgi:ATP-dependent helicase/nuclease subunit B
LPVATDTSTTNRVTLLPFDADPLEVLAQQILHENDGQLPRLDRITVLLPDSSDAPRLRQQLLQQAEILGHPALLGPRILGWRNWLAEIPLTESAGISEYRRELILVQALHKHSTLFGAANHWALAESLLQLFDEMTLNKVGLPEDEEEFQRRVAGAYGLGNRTLGAMDREAQLVHTLWRAWHQELKQRGLLDRNARYLLQLAASLDQELEHPLFLFAPTTANRAEREWLAALVEKGSVRLLLQGHNNGIAEEAVFHPHAPLRQLLRSLDQEARCCHGNTDYSRMLDTLFAPHSDTPLRERASNFSREITASPLEGRLAVYPANDDEEEARAVELQVRRWLLQGKRRIGIVSDNRRLARRLRALLERANVPLQDAAGWALSTTSAAAILERWLQCIEEDFPHRAMLDLLKSPFFCQPAERDNHLTEVYLLERDIILHENIGSGLQRYRQNLKYRQRRLPTDLASRLNPVDTLLERLQEAAEPLQ